MSILALGAVRMVHRLGGPYKEVQAIRNGPITFIEWPMNGLIRIVDKTGALWDNRKGPWTMHPDDLKRIHGIKPYSIKAMPQNSR